MAIWTINNNIQFLDKQSDTLPNWKAVAISNARQLIHVGGVSHWLLEFDTIAGATSHNNLSFLAKTQPEVSLLCSEYGGSNCVLLSYSGNRWGDGNYYVGKIKLAKTSYGTTNSSSDEIPITGLSATSTNGPGGVFLQASVTTGTNVLYNWVFGDGATATSQNAQHVYAPGIYTATVTATNPIGTASQSLIISITEELITNLAIQTEQLSDGTYQFNATSQTGSNILYNWDFGDGTGSNMANLTHTFSTVGSYTVTLTASNSRGTVTETTTVVVENQPIAGLTINGSTPVTLGSSINFTASVSQGTNVSYSWNFGDGTSGSGASVNRTYAAVGSYTVTVTATNTQGSATASLTITVINEEIAGLTLSNDGPTELGSITTFTYDITDGTNVSYSWNFGDGTTA